MTGYQEVLASPTAVCSGATIIDTRDLTSPGWGEDQGITACKQLCDSNTECNAFAWSEDTTCHTYATCDEALDAAATEEALSSLSYVFARVFSKREHRELITLVNHIHPSTLTNNLHACLCLIRLSFWMRV